ncbi:uncharacterized protein L969DRAFT_89734 [Mixia osmundae IAM 14324]|uniref:uncharacterized protein n=1 Tax=Mixia osmundae (strain CBS 9802 / IAM 14324 / JCM 22182 / KY 12970) TaxID=764103 RepID=UPI0004A549BA|nr:uncharacterized protein L969DRAFT_89734 [Mixia osmundae IAM 14324]KEI37762.1 hypothetical protein L969DRAFT_89734 [Mixia osmundae IAM 14324]
MAAPPSFSSFPSLQESPRAGSTRRSEHQDDPSGFDARRSKHHHHPKDDSTSSRSRKRARHDDSASRSHKKSEDATATFIKAALKSAPRPFVQESPATYWHHVQGDRDNLVYGKPNKPPQYSRHRSRYVLGLPRRYRISYQWKSIGQTVCIIEHKKPKAARYTSIEQQARLRKVPTKRLTASHTRQSEQADFVALSSSKRSQAEPTTRIIERIDAEPSDSESEPDAAFDDTQEVALQEDEEAISSYFARRSREFNAALREDPSNVELWLEYASYQTEVALLNSESSLQSGRSRRLTAKESLAVEEIRLAILDKAHSHQSNQSDVRLLLARLECFSRVVPDTGSVLNEWQKALDLNANSIELWSAYLRYRTGESKSFELAKVLDLYLEVLQLLKRRIQLYSINSPEREDLEVSAIRILLKACLVMRAAGFAERAFAILQAQIELNFFSPDDAVSEDELFARFETFWDSEAPRIGESSAQGWCKSDLSASAEHVAHKQLLSYQHDLIERWQHDELTSAQSSILPSRSETELHDEASDPFRVVLFADISNFLSVYACVDSKLHLRYAVLDFMELAYPAPDTSTLWNEPDEFGSARHMARSFWPEYAEPTTEQLLAGTRASTVNSAFDCRLKALPVTPDTVFCSSTWFSVTDALDTRTPYATVAVNMLWALAETGRDPFFKLLALAFQSQLDHKRAVKMAKHLLKKESSALMLWDGYARMQLGRGKIDEARQVFASAIQIGANLSEASKVDLPLLFRSWAEMESESGNVDFALSIAVASVTPNAELPNVNRPCSPPSAIHLLRTRQQLTRILSESCLSGASASLLRHRTSIYATLCLLEYHVKGYSSMLRTVQKPLEDLIEHNSTRAEHEELLMINAKFAYRASKEAAFRPRQVSEQLESGLAHFPSNAVLLALYHHIEARSKLRMNFARTIDNVVLASGKTTVSSYLFAIWAEMRFNAFTFNKAIVRELFERAVDDPRSV